MKKGLLFFSFIIFSLSVYSQNNWDGDDSLGNFSWCNNWYSNSCPSTWNSSTDLIFNYNNNSHSSLYLDLGGWKDVKSILFQSSYNSAVILDSDNSGNNGFNFWYKVENNSSTLKTIACPLSGKGTAIEINPVNGDLTLNKDVYNDNNVDYYIYGNNSKTLTLNGYLVGNSSVDLFIKQYSKVFIKYNNATSFSGKTYIEMGELWIGANSALNGGDIYVGNGNSNTAKVYIYDSSVATSVSNNIVVPSNSSNSTIGGLNSSNKHTYSGTINLNNNLVNFDEINAGELEVSGIISGTGGITKIGNGKLTLSGNNTYSGNTTVNAGTVEITGSINCNTMTVASGATLIVNGATVKMSSLVNNGTVLVKSGHTLEVTNAITNNSGAILTVEDTASVLQTAGTSNSNSNAGTINVYRKTTPYVQYDYTYWSSPIYAADLNSVFASNPNNKYWFNTANYKDLVGADDAIGHGFPQSAGGADTFDDDNDAWQSASGTMNRGQGYIVQGTAADASTGQTVNFTASGDNGKLNNGDISLAVVLDKWHADSETTFSTFNNNQNLIGNPYPSAVDLDAFKNDSDNTELTGTFHFWTHHTPMNASIDGPYIQNFTDDDYSTYTVGTGGAASASGGTAPSRYLASGQSFFADVTSAGTIIFKNAHRVSNENNHFLKTGSNQDRLWLNFNASNGEFRQILVGFINDSSDDYNPYYDGQRLENGVGFDFYSYIPSQPEVRLAVNGLGTFDVTKVVPLGLEITENGTHQISLDRAEGIFNEGQAIYLKDNLTGTLHDMSTGSYSFTQNTIDHLNDRFEIVFTSTMATDTVTADSFAVYPNPSAGVFQINSRVQGAMQVTVTDITGKLIKNLTFDNLTPATIDLSNVVSGIYLAKISVNGSSVTKKLVVE